MRVSKFTTTVVYDTGDHLSTLLYLIGYFGEQYRCIFSRVLQYKERVKIGKDIVHINISLAIYYTTAFEKEIL